MILGCFLRLWTTCRYLLISGIETKIHLLKTRESNSLWWTFHLHSIWSNLCFQFVETYVQEGTNL